ncbi:putative membrane protein [Shigella flexneri 1235-66]|nr:putative membrane protein [Shigella flexneri 1235-66]
MSTATFAGRMEIILTVLVLFGIQLIGSINIGGMIVSI